MSVITPEILSYHRIYCKNKLTEEINQEVESIADFLKKELPIEKLYFYGSTVYGYPNEKSDYDFMLVLDCDETRIDEVVEAYHQIEGMFSRSVHTLPTPLYGFAKRASQPTDMEFYVCNYGVLLFDSEKSATVKAITHTVYSAIKDNYDFLKSNTYLKYDLSIITVYLKALLRLYATKRAYSPLDEDVGINDLTNYVSLFADDLVKTTIAKYNKLIMDRQNIDTLAKLITEFSAYVLSLKNDKNI